MNDAPLAILLVEDNPDHAELVRRNLEAITAANRLVHVEDGEAALDYLHGVGRFARRRDTERPRLVLLDLRLPRVDGLVVLQNIKSDAALQNIPVVILTTSEADPDIAAAYENGANSYLTKPVDYVSFSRLLRDLGIYWLTWNRQPA